MSKDIRLAIDDCEKQIEELEKYREKISKLHCTIHELRMICKHPESYIQGSYKHYHTNKMCDTYICPDCGQIWDEGISIKATFDSKITGGKLI